VLCLIFFGMGFSEIRSFDNQKPSSDSCLGFPPDECLASAGSAQGPDKHQLAEERANALRKANAQTVIENRRRAQAQRERRRNRQQNSPTTPSSGSSPSGGGNSPSGGD